MLILNLTTDINYTFINSLYIYRLHSTSINSFLRKFFEIGANENYGNMLLFGDFNLYLMALSLGVNNLKAIIAQFRFTSLINNQNKQFL